MKAYFAACGMGVGHVTRCEPIAEALSKSGANVIFCTYSDGADYVTRKRLRAVRTVPLSVSMDNDGAIDFKRTAASDPGFFRGIWLILKQIVTEIKNMQTTKPDVVISDSRLSSLIAAKLLAIPTVLILNQYKVLISGKSNGTNDGLLDRLFYFVANTVWFFARVIIGEFWSLADRIVIPDLPPPNTVSVQNIAIPTRHRNKIKFVGPIMKIPVFTQDDKSLIRKRLGLRVDRPVLFAPISMPKAGRGSFVKLFAEMLCDLDEEYEIVLSRGIVDGTRSPRREGNVLVYDWIDNQVDFYTACDAVICRAGHGTIMNSMIAGKPMIIIPIPNHPEQIGNATRASELGVAKVLSQSELGAERLKDLLRVILNEDVYARRVSEIKATAQALGGLRATLDVIESVLQSRGRYNIPLNNLDDVIDK